ncbi:MAG: FecR domain-containing protein [Deltaproteobacteria bacterium]
MTTEEQIEEYRARSERRFDELREQRVLARVREARRGQPSRQSRIVAPLLAAAAAAAFVFALDRLVLPSSAPWVLVDGSEVLLAEGAHVELAHADGAGVRLLQSRGRARYDVTRRAGRTFEVVTPEATVRVRGTSFDVEASSESTEVLVHEGVVEVDDGARQILLRAGERLRVTGRAADTVDPPAAQPRGGGSGETPADAHAETRAGQTQSDETQTSAVQAPVAQTEPDAAPVAELEPVPSGAPVVRSSQARASREPRSRPSASRESLLARADEARARGAFDAAVPLYLEAESLGSVQDQAEVAMLLARLESRRGRPERAVRAYERCLRYAPDGPLAEDALAGAAQGWADVGALERAREAAAHYRARWPSGLHDAAMRRLLAR